MKNEELFSVPNSAFFIFHSSLYLAEGEGFEPPVPLRVRLISSQVRSAELCHPSMGGKNVGDTIRGNDTRVNEE